jgi:hypothetical protein
VTSMGFLAIYHQHTGVDGGALVHCGPDSTLQSILEVQGSPVLHNEGKEIAEERGILGEESLEVEGALGGHQLIEPDRTRRKRSPLLGGVVTMVGVRASLAHSFEYHPASLWNLPVQGNE